MRVVSYGTKDVFRIQCKNCESVIEFNETEEDSKIQQYWGGHYLEYYISCPVCKGEIKTKTKGNLENDYREKA